jgi:hypothetical protein
MVNVHVIKFMQ